jgi:hypothetical protein
MNVWIVEDDDNDANRALEAMTRLGLGDRAAVFRDKTIRWGADLARMPSAEGEMPVCGLDHMPAIVVLDLLDEDGKFRAGDFYNRLRAEEAEHPPASFVIVWSVKTGLQEVHKFLSEKPTVDRRLNFTNTKTDLALDAALARALRSWQEAQYL